MRSCRLRTRRRLAGAPRVVVQDGRRSILQRAYIAPLVFRDLGSQHRLTGTSFNPFTPDIPIWPYALSVSPGLRGWMGAPAPTVDKNVLKNSLVLIDQPIRISAMLV